MAKKNITLKEMSNHMSILKRHIYDELRQEGKLLNAWWGLPETARGSIEEEQLIQEKLKKGVYDESERHRQIAFNKSHPFAIHDPQNPDKVYKTLRLDQICHTHYKTILELFEKFKSKELAEQRKRALKFYNDAFDFYAMHKDCLNLDKIPSEIRCIIRNRQNAKARYYQIELLIDLLFKKDGDECIKKLFKSMHYEVNTSFKEKLKNILARGLPFDEKDPNKKRRRIERYIQKELANSFKLFFEEQLSARISILFYEIMQNKLYDLFKIKYEISTQGDISHYYLMRNTNNHYPSIPVSKLTTRQRANFESDGDKVIFHYPQSKKIPRSIINIIENIPLKDNQTAIRYTLRQIDFYEKLLYYISNSIKNLPKQSNSGASSEEAEIFFYQIEQQYLNRKDQDGMSIYDELKSLYNRQIELFLQGKQGSTLINKLVS